MGRKANSSLSLVDVSPSPSSPDEPRTIPIRGRLMVKSGGRILFLRPEEIDWIEARGDYVCLHVQEKKHVIRGKIGEFESSFAPEHFFRIHRSALVAIDRIREFQPLQFGEYQVTLLDGTTLTMSRSHRETVFKRMQNSSL